MCTSGRTTSPEPSAGWRWSEPRPRGRWRIAIRSLRATAQNVREMEGTLARVRENIAEIVQKLAAYVRARLERSRGRSGPDRGWSRIMANALDRVKAAEAEVHGDG